MEAPKPEILLVVGEEKMFARNFFCVRGTVRTTLLTVDYWLCFFLQCSIRIAAEYRKH